MSKIKEELLNNLSEDEMEQRYGLSAFEYVELMDKYKPQIESNEVNEDVIYQQWLEQEKMNEQYWAAKAEETMDRINAYYDTRYCAADVEGAIAEVTNDERVIGAIMKNLNELYLKRTVYELQQVQVVDTK